MSNLKIHTQKLKVQGSCSVMIRVYQLPVIAQGDTKKRELLKTPTKIEEIQEKKFID